MAVTSEYEFTNSNRLCVENRKCDIDTEEECRKAANVLSSNLRFDGTKSVGTRPKGCFVVPRHGAEKVYFNPHAVGSAYEYAWSICKICGRF